MIWELGEGKTKAGVHFPVAQEVKASFNILGFEIECVFWGASSCIVTWVFEGSYPSNLEGFFSLLFNEVNLREQRWEDGLDGFFSGEIGWFKASEVLLVLR